ncbi:MAG: type II secretion system ATPase GspE [Desulfobacterales bacterium]
MQPALLNDIQTHYQIDGETLTEIEQIRVDKGEPLGEILLRRKVLTETQLMEAQSRIYGLPFWSELPLENFSTSFTEKVSIQFLKRHLMVPLLVEQNPPAAPEGATLAQGPRLRRGLHDTNTPVIAIHDPSRFHALDDLIRLLVLDDYKVVLASRSAILSAINISYDLNRDSAEQLVQDMEEDGSAIISELADATDLLEDASDAPIIKLVNHIISQSIKARASDIHIEPYQQSFKVRYRVDGILYDLLTPPKWIQPALISRIKVMADLNIAEKRLPQDGRIEVRVGDQNIDIRVSTLPTTFGERVVLRLLNKSGSLLKITDIGLEPQRLETLNQLIKSPNGIILVTGPTGSGKTTSLYAVLSHLNKPDINIITIEDPIEYQINGISQIQVNPKIELTFARGLRSIVRQDPDIILVGEIRDRETAEIAVQSALTGHLVFSTLHTNDAASAITRLVDIGVEPFLISSSVLAVAAQRLVRVLCHKCKEPYQPDAPILKSIGISANQLQGRTIYRAKGCQDCFHTGYRGRIGIFEVMVFDSNLQNIILETYDSNQIKNEALRLKMVTLRQDGIQKVLKGISTIEEVLRVTQF